MSESVAPSGRVGYRNALVSREFRALLVGQAVSILGTSVAGVALAVLVYRRSGSPFLSALTFSLAFLPYVLGGGLLSGLVDRVRPRRLVVSCDLSSGLIAAAMAWRGMPVALLLALMFGLGTLSSVASGARGALVRQTATPERYVAARSLLKLAAQSAQILGAALGGVLVVALTPSGAILVNAASFLFSASLVRIRVRDYPRSGGDASRGGLMVDSLRGAREILAHNELRRLLLLGWLVPMFSVAPEALGAPYVAAHGGSASLVGLWLAALPLGLILGDLAGVRWLTARQQQRLVVPAAAASFVPYLAFVVKPAIPAALVLLLASGACGLYSLGLDGRVLDATPEPLFPRTMALSSAGLMTLQGLGFALAGAIAQGIGASAAIAVAGTGGLVAIALLRREAPQPTGEPHRYAPTR
jgi:predicted MFS family arabinose efflux permease